MRKTNFFTKFKMIKQLICFLLLQFVATSPLFSQDDDFRFGLGLTYVNPSWEANMGPYFVAEAGLIKNLVLRGSLGYISFRKRKDGFGIKDNKRITDSISLETDLVYGRLFYISVGVGALSNTWESTDITGESYRHKNFTSSAGVGLKVSNFKHRFTVGYKQVFIFPVRWSVPTFYIEDQFSFR